MLLACSAFPRQVTVFPLAALLTTPAAALSIFLPSTALSRFYPREVSALPSGWVYVGCRAEPPNGRILSQETTLTSNTPSSCISLCINNGYQLAGVEYGQECWCGNAANQPVFKDESACTMPCNGNYTETCGGDRLMNLYGPVGTTTDTWAYQGCYVDSNSNRVLTGAYNQWFTDMTVESCQAYCSGYAFAGMEWSHECYCGNTFSTTVAANSECSNTCDGDSTEVCGGSLRLSIYRSAPIVANATTTSTSTTTTTATTTAAPTQSQSGWTSQGCFYDATSNRALKDKIDQGLTGMTQETCMSYCAGYTYAGMEFGHECYCGNTFSVSAAPDSDCSSTCDGDPSETCGGAERLTVFKSSTPTTTSSSSSTTSVSASVPSHSGWTTFGCWVDHTANRILSAQMNQAFTGMTEDSCLTFCAGYVWAGVEYGHECYCGNALFADSAPDSDCSTPCDGDPSQLCGGAERMNAFLHVPKASSNTDSTLPQSTPPPTGTGAP